MQYGATSTGKKKTSTQIIAMPSSLLGMVITPSSIGVTTVRVYDSKTSSTSDQMLLEIVIPAGDSSVPVTMPFSIPASKGLYFTITEDSGAGVAAYIGYYSAG